LVARWVLGRFEKGKEKPLEALEEGVCRGFLVFGGKRGEDRGSRIMGQGLGGKGEGERSEIHGSRIGGQKGRKTLRLQKGA